MILIVDDEPELRELLASGLSLLGWECETAEDGAEALEKIFRSPKLYTLICTDATMPKLSGYDLAKALRAKCISIPVVLLTGNDTHGPPNAEIVRMVSKPIDLQELSTIFKEILT